MSELKRFEIVQSIGHCEGTQTFACMAHDAAEALQKHERGETEIIEESVEVQDFSGTPEAYESDDISSRLLSDEITRLQWQLDKANSALSAIYESGDYNRVTLGILRDALGLGKEGA